MKTIGCNNEAGNLTTDHRGYTYQYDYENRVTKTQRGATDIAEYSHDALGRRVEKKDCITSGNTRRYYYDKDWRVVNDYDGSNNLTRQYLWGNYIDEVLFSWAGVTPAPSGMRFYAHDHLHSPVALLSAASAVLERYEYDAYGEPNILDGSYNPRSPQASTCDNSYLFTGRQVDILDGGALKIQYNRNRYYDYYTGRWTTQDPLGITPDAAKPNVFDVGVQYARGANLYLYCQLRPHLLLDPSGLDYIWSPYPGSGVIVGLPREEPREPMDSYESYVIARWLWVPKGESPRAILDMYHRIHFVERVELIHDAAGALVTGCPSGILATGWDVGSGGALTAYARAVMSSCWHCGGDLWALLCTWREGERRRLWGWGRIRYFSDFRGCEWLKCQNEGSACEDPPDQGRCASRLHHDWGDVLGYRPHNPVTNSDRRHIERAMRDAYIDDEMEW